MSCVQRPRLLFLLGCYWPGNEATGPNQSFRALASALRRDFDIKVVARDGAGNAPPGWHAEDIAARTQLQTGWMGARGLLRLLRETPHDLLCLNGFHDREFTVPALVWRKLGLIPRKPTILSPRGEFAGGALSLKAGRKRIFQEAVQRSGLTRDIWLHATASHEQRDIEAAGLPTRGILLAPNVRLLPDSPKPPPRKDSDPLQVAFLGRIAPVKNLEFALNVLRRVSMQVVFNIYGPVVDHDYWEYLKPKIACMPRNIVVHTHGNLAHHEVATTLATHDLFFLPTKGENFGHAINESLAACLPVLTSDMTPWRGLAKHNAGWDLPLDEPQAFVKSIETLARASLEERSLYRRGARVFAERSFLESNALEANLQMLRHVLDDWNDGRALAG